VVAADGRLQGTGDVGRGGTTVNAAAPLADIPVYRRVTAAANRRRASREGSPGEGRDRTPVEPQRSASTGASPARIDDELPFTGLDLRLPAGLGLMALISGLTLRFAVARSGR